ncbi:MAG: hypothetical protein V4501_02150 [Pseudomonadota bacterium]
MGIDNASCDKCSKYSKLSICSLGFAVGLTNGIGMMLLAYMAMMNWVGDSIITMVSSVYHGYAPTVVGGLLGLGWGFLDGFVFGMLVALFYNCCRCCCKCCCKNCGCKRSNIQP